MAHELNSILKETVTMGVQYILTRLDDNNNEIEMNRFTDKQTALAQKHEFTRRGHKQHYYVYQLNNDGTKRLVD